MLSSNVEMETNGKKRGRSRISCNDGNWEVMRNRGLEKDMEALDRREWPIEMERRHCGRCKLTINIKQKTKF